MVLIQIDATYAVLELAPMRFANYVILIDEVSNNASRAVLFGLQFRLWQKDKMVLTGLSHRSGVIIVF
jgi:hypothetical protein